MSGAATGGRGARCGPLRDRPQGRRQESRDRPALELAAASIGGRQMGLLRLSLVTETFPPEVNGVARTLETIAAGLRGRGHAVEVVRPRRPDLPPLDGARGPDRVPAAAVPGRDGATARPGAAWDGELRVGGAPLPGYPGLRFGAFCPGRLDRHWRHERPDVVHVATEGPLGLAALLAARSLGIPVTSSFHTNFHLYGRHYGFGPLRQVAVAYLRALHNRAALTFCPPGTALETLAELGFERLQPLGRGVDAELFDPRRRSGELRHVWGAADGDLVVLHVGRLAREKNLGLACDAFAAMRAAAPGCRLVMVGDGPARRELERRRPDAVFCGERRGDDLAAHYASGDVFLFPSLTETFGNVVLEAMASGLAVVAYDCAAAGVHVTPGVNGLLAPPGDEAAFVAAAAAAARRPSLAARYGRAARAVARGITWESVVRQFERVLSQALQHGSR